MIIKILVKFGKLRFVFNVRISRIKEKKKKKETQKLKHTRICLIINM